MLIRLNNQLPTILCLLTGSLLLTACAGKKSGGSNAAAKSQDVSSVESLEQSADLSVKLSLDDGDEVLTMAVLPDGLLSLATKNGHAFVVDPEDESAEKIASYFKFDPQATTALTVNKDYLWVISLGDATVGRNKQPPDQAKKVEISKVPVDDLIDTNAATPVHASETQLYLATGDGLVVFTFSGSFINRKKVPFPGEKLHKQEYVLGAGPLGDAGSTAHYWMITNQRLLRFNGTDWTSKDVVVKGKKEDSNLVALHFGSKDEEVEEKAFGLFGGNLVTALEAGISDKEEDAEESDKKTSKKDSKEADDEDED